LYQVYQLSTQCSFGRVFHGMLGQGHKPDKPCVHLNNILRGGLRGGGTHTAYLPMAGMHGLKWPCQHGPCKAQTWVTVLLLLSKCSYKVQQGARGRLSDNKATSGVFGSKLVSRSAHTTCVGGGAWRGIL
jgi:hypothetical protein